jgi:hypothetical protein
LEDKVASKLVPWIGKHATMAENMPQWPSVQPLSNISTLTSVVIYFINMLDVPLEVLLKIDSIQRVFPWATSEKVSRGKCKVQWEFVCEPKEYEITKFTSALRLRWLWNEWFDESKP